MASGSFDPEQAIRGGQIEKLEILNEAQQGLTAAQSAARSRLVREYNANLEGWVPDDECYMAERDSAEAERRFKEQG